MLLDFNNFKVRVTLILWLLLKSSDECRPDFLLRQQSGNSSTKNSIFSSTGKTQIPAKAVSDWTTTTRHSYRGLQPSALWSGKIRVNGAVGGLKPHHPLIFACLFFTKLRTYTTWSMPWLGFIFSVYNLEALGYDNFYHAWFHFPTTLCPKDWEKTIWTTLGSNPACQLSKQPRYPLHASPL